MIFACTALARIEHYIIPQRTLFKPSSVPSCLPIPQVPAPSSGFSCSHSHRDRASTPSTAMAGGGSNKGVPGAAQLLGVMCVLVVLSLVADSTEAAGVCNPNALYPCLRAIEGARPPSPSKQCCAVVKGVDKTCMCRQLKAGSFPAQMVSNALRLPKKCGRTDLRGFKCGRYTFPY